MSKVRVKQLKSLIGRKKDHKLCISGLGLKRIGDEKILDIQACVGTHVRSTGEIIGLEIGKIENKGKRNRRVNIRFKS